MSTIIGLTTLLITIAIAPKTTMTSKLAKEKAYKHAQYSL